MESIKLEPQLVQTQLPLCVIQSPLDTRSGYGDMARDIARHIVELGKYEVVLVSLPWGGCPMGAVSPDNPKDANIIGKMAVPPVQLNRQPDLYIHISVPNEFQRMGKYNIGITAGMETTAISLPWVEGCNKMDLILTISEHSKRVIQSTVIEQRDSRTNTLVNTITVQKPVEVLHNCVHTDLFRKIEPSELLDTVTELMLPVKEKFNYLFVGHWIKGGLGSDRKNIGILIKTFCETFKNVSRANRPGLILKTSGAGFSVLDREECLAKINEVRRMCGPNSPNVYLIHGELTDDEMNSLYNHPKIKVHVSFTKGEGFGRPLLEACMTEKPIIASGWSGHIDFLNPDDAMLLPGELRNVEPDAVWENVILAESKWFNVDETAASQALKMLFEDYDNFLAGAKKLADDNKVKFSYDAIKNRTDELLKKYVSGTTVVPAPLAQSINSLTSTQQNLTLPTLKKVEPK